MRLYFGGSEINGHRNLLHEADVRNMAMSYMGLRRRVKFSKPWVISEKFDPHVSVFLDSGAYTLNTKDDIETSEIEEIYEHYVDFVNANLERVDLVSEFDALAMGRDWIEEQRDVFWSKIPREKFMAIWHPAWGISYLQEMASLYEVIGIPDTVLDGRDLRPVLNALAVKGTRLHGVAMTQMHALQDIRWDSVASTSWISPQQYGDTIVWTGKELKRYPKKYKDRARKQYRTLFKNMGLDAEAIANDDPNEVLRLSIVSWQKFEEYVNNRHKSGNVVTPLFSNAEPPKVETDLDVVDKQPETADNVVATTGNSTEVAVRREPTTMLPVMNIFKPEDEEDKGGDRLIIRSESARVCNSCFLAEKCPGYQPDSNCIYNIPIQIRTREQVKALRQGMIEMQTQRVLFMRMAEEVEGGYADPNLTKEIHVLDKMITAYEEAEREGFNITISASGRGSQRAEGSMFSRMFGSDAGQRVQQIEGGPIQADSIIEAEVVGEDE